MGNGAEIRPLEKGRKCPALWVQMDQNLIVILVLSCLGQIKNKCALGNRSENFR